MVSPTKKPGEYMAYMLRIWPLRNKSRLLWRATLENAQTGERVGFASLDELFDYLRQQTGQASRPDEWKK
jgi:hypothetical protein